MRKDHRPAWLKHFQLKLNKRYVQHFIAPELESLGNYPHIVGPRHLRLFGAGIHIGDCLHMACDPDRNVRLIAWPNASGPATIRIGNYCLISPGVKIQAADSVVIGDNCMLAAEASISDSDWHGLYNRLRPFGNATAAVTLGDNVWIGERAIVTKGVSIGNNSVVGAGAVVTSDVPQNVVVAGVPAKIVKHLIPKRRMLKREAMFTDAQHFEATAKELDRYVMGANSLFGWLRQLVAPNKKR